MAKKVLVTFGCSWMYGVGTGYEEGMTLKDYNILRYSVGSVEVANTVSFRGLLAKKYNFENINFGLGGSSNQHQFLLLKKFFNSDRYKDLVKENAEIVVLHGITSTARSYFYDINANIAKDIMFNNGIAQSPAIKSYVLNYYNHEHEIQLLTEEIQFINQFYKGNGIKNLWFDTFNTHKYNFELDNFLGHNDFETRDLLSQMALETGIEDMDRKYHTSTWRVDSNRVEFLVNSKHLNPFSQHPTKLGHQLIADIISKELENII
jgi:hypothetical protein